MRAQCECCPSFGSGFREGLTAPAPSGVVALAVEEFRYQAAIARTQPDCLTDILISGFPRVDIVVDVVPYAQFLLR